jgi:anthranilate phosphoribosyltransferase
MIQEAIAKLVGGESLSDDEATSVMAEIMAGEATPAQIGSFVTALRMKGETVGEIAGLARAMRDRSHRVVTASPAIDTCGTGGDGSGTINVSTTAAFVAAGAGVSVAKHGNRAMTSKCGSADVLEALGVNITLDAEQVGRCIDEERIGFMFAPLFHPAMKHAAGPRRELGFRTVFNILGPLTNPAGATAQVLGVGSPDLVETMAHVLLSLGSQHALVVHGEDGVDEISISAPTLVAEVADGVVRTYRVAPEDVGLTRSDRSAIKGGTAAENAEALRAILRGKPGPGRDVVLLNAAAALVVGGRAGSLAEGVRLAGEVIDSGQAIERVDGLVRKSQELGR